MFSVEYRMDLKSTDFYKLVKEYAEHELLTYGLKCRIPHVHILAIAT